MCGGPQVRTERETTVENTVARIFGPHGRRIDGEWFLFQRQKGRSSTDAGSKCAGDRHDGEEVRILTIAGAREEGKQGATAHYGYGPRTRIQDQRISGRRRHEGRAGPGVHGATGLLEAAKGPDGNDRIHGEHGGALSVQVLQVLRVWTYGDEGRTDR